MKPVTKYAVVAAFTIPGAGTVAVLALVIVAAAGSAAATGSTAADGFDMAGRECAEAGVAGLSAGQTRNAKIVTAVAVSRGLGRRGTVIGVMTALTESGLVNVGHGDAA